MHCYTYHNNKTSTQISTYLLNHTHTYTAHNQINASTISPYTTYANTRTIRTILHTHIIQIYNNSYHNNTYKTKYMLFFYSKLIMLHLNSERYSFDLTTQVFHTTSALTTIVIQSQQKPGSEGRFLLLFTNFLYRNSLVSYGMTELSISLWFDFLCLTAHVNWCCFTENAL